MSISAYNNTIKRNSDPREIEYRIFQRVTNALRPYKGKKGFDELTQDFKAAIWDNQVFWNTLRAELFSPENGLPTELRAHLISLATFIDNHSASILRGHAVIDPIIEINENVMAGIKPHNKEEEKPS